MCIRTVFTGAIERVVDKLTGIPVESGIVQEPNKIWVGNAYYSRSPLDCMANCARDKKCKSVTFNGPGSVNEWICVLAYGVSTEQFKIINPYKSVTQSAPRCCHCDCLPK